MARPWRRAVNDLRCQLEDTSLIRDGAKRRFQCGRLFENLVREFEQIASAEHSQSIDPVTFVITGEQAYWLFCGSPWEDDLGYNEARKQHFAELETLGLSRKLKSAQNKDDWAAWLGMLFFRLSSLASWIEAHEALVAWRALGFNRAAWDSADPNVRYEALHAAILAKRSFGVETFSDRFIADLVKDFSCWEPLQWTKILKRAARLTQQSASVTEFDNWLWWRFPIFYRYRWSAAEAHKAVAAKFPKHSAVRKGEGAFKSYCVRRGLHFSGRRRRKRQPPLSKFVHNVPVPDRNSIPKGLFLFYSY